MSSGTKAQASFEGVGGNVKKMPTGDHVVLTFGSYTLGHERNVTKVPIIAPLERSVPSAAVFKPAQEQ